MREITDNAHSILGPSAGERWINCPGSVLATKDLPDQPTEFAAEGTAAHTLSEWCREQNVKVETFRGEILKVGEFEFEVDQEMIDGVQSFIDDVNQFNGEPHYELRVSYEGWVPGGFGTVDDTRLRNGIIPVTDLKYGKGVAVYAEDNIQLKLYALGILHDWDWLYEILGFRLRINQPRLDYLGEWDISTKDLREWATEIVWKTAKIALQPGAPFKAGEWCQFCKLKETCRTRAESVFKAAIGEFENLDDAAETASEMAVDPGAHELSNDELARAWQALSGIRAWCSDIENRIKKEMSAGRPVGDLKFVAGRGSRDWNSEPGLITSYLAMEGFEVEDLYESNLRSPAKMEKLITKTHPLFKQFVKHEPGKPTIAAGKDPRPAYALDPATEFEPLD